MSSNPSQIPTTEIEDWFANPITEYFFTCIQSIADRLHEDKQNCFVPGEPFTTHERHSWHLGAEWMAGQLLDMNADKEIRGADDEQ
ncbi:MAG: hypothetical protein AMS22_15350 [Thiotrichales bacterium SG8_50]|nr:MAG: hypothetical protein AMS22_15350 [Thiotrichales bacterium SG8_50]